MQLAPVDAYTVYLHIRKYTFVWSTVQIYIFVLLQVSAEWEAIYTPDTDLSHCSISTLSERPNVIENVTLDSLIVMRNTYMYKVEASWSKPDSFNGAFDKYEVTLTSEALDPNADEPSSSAEKVFISEVGRGKQYFVNVCVLVPVCFIMSKRWYTCNFV